MFNKQLLIYYFILCIAAFIISECFLKSETIIQKNNSETEAVALAEKWFENIRDLKLKRNIPVDTNFNSFNWMLGDEYSELTTTLGSYEAKDVAANPNFASYIIRLLDSAKVDSGKTVGIITTGSFPSLNIAVLAALQSKKLNVILLFSVGASTFGANQPDCTWLDMEKYLIDNAGLNIRSSIVTYGAENDRGESFSNEGQNIADNAALRNGYAFRNYQNLEESILSKTQYLLEKKIQVLINIGGNQAALGLCNHSYRLPTGLNINTEICNDKDRGIIARIAENGIPFIHLLNIRDIALKNNIPVFTKERNNIQEKNITYNKTGIIILIIILLIPLIVFLSKKIIKGKSQI